MRYFVLLLLLYLSIVCQIAVIPALGLQILKLNLPLMFLAGAIVFRPRTEILFYSALLGLIFDSLSFLPLPITLFLLPLICFFDLMLTKKLWPRPNIFSCLFSSFFLITAFSLFVFFEKIPLTRAGLPFFEIILQNSRQFGLDLLKSFISNSLLLVPPVYFILKRLNELFEYWEQRKRI
ncbi:MAG: rod shape-determining protein MreD [Patescibacteria group bacterium]